LLLFSQPFSGPEKAFVPEPDRLTVSSPPVPKKEPFISPIFSRQTLSDRLSKRSLPNPFFFSKNRPVFLRAVLAAAQLLMIIHISSSLKRMPIFPQTFPVPPNRYVLPLFHSSPCVISPWILSFRDVPYHWRYGKLMDFFIVTSQVATAPPHPSSTLRFRALNQYSDFVGFISVISPPFSSFTRFPPFFFLRVVSTFSSPLLIPPILECREPVGFAGNLGLCFDSVPHK